jgi:hypothetical protein
MSCDTGVYNPCFMGVSGIGSTLIINELENNYKSFLDWGFLNAGGFVNVNIPTTNIVGFNLHILKPTQDKNFASNTVWQTPRKDWVYESGISYGASSPIMISGIYVNNTFYPGPTGNATLSYKINYPQGKIIFSSGISPSSVVQMNYSYKTVQVYKMEEFPYWQEIQNKSLENKTGFSLSGSGDFSIGSEHRIQLPAVIIETAPSSRSRPFRLGDKSLIMEQDMLLHILSDNRSDRNTIVDILKLQEDREIWLYDTNNVVKSGVYPINYDGTKNQNGQNYNIIVNDSNYRWLLCRILNVNISDILFANLRMHGSVVRLTNEIIFTAF